MPIELLLVYLVPPVVLAAAVAATIRTRVWYLPGAMLVVTGLAVALAYEAHGPLGGLDAAVVGFVGVCVAGFGVLVIIVSRLLHGRAMRTTPREPSR